MQQAKNTDSSRERLDLASIPDEIDEWDVVTFRRLTSTELTEEQRERVLAPSRVYPKQRSVLAIHWHPEFIPLDDIRARIDATFPGRDRELIIPTQHNTLVSWGHYTGVEVDCYCRSFHRKVQLLIHFESERLEGRGDVFKSMLEHTQRYRASQLYAFIDSVVLDEFDARVEEAARATGADEDLLRFVRIYMRRIRKLVDRFDAETPRQMVKNKIVRNYFDALRDRYDAKIIHHAQLFLTAVKMIVKREFPLEYFYEMNEIVEEVRALGGGVIIPHPEQFWPILLDEVDVDGIEVWNPQSFQYTQFLIDVLNRKNSEKRHRERPLLVTMGDDCHMGEKVKEPWLQDAEKAGREIGVQPPWDNLSIRKRLISANQSRHRAIEEYTARLS